MERTATPGVATGLAVTGAGGDVLFIEATAMVIRARPGDSGQPDLYELALCFEDPDTYGDALRRIVFAEQLRSRAETGGGPAGDRRATCG